MWNRLQHVSWVFVFLLLLGTGTGIAHATPRPLISQNNWSLPTSASSMTSTTFAGDFNKFAGLWVAHSAFMVVARDGNAHFGARTYNWCNTNAPPPCDSIVGDQLRYGYHEQLLLSRMSDAVAYGTVLASNEHPANQKTGITLTLEPDDTLLYASDSSVTLLCGPSAPIGACGA